MEEVPLQVNSDERDFEMDECDFLLQPPDHELRGSGVKHRSSKKCCYCLSVVCCG